MTIDQLWKDIGGVAAIIAAVAWAAKVVVDRVNQRSLELLKVQQQISKDHEALLDQTTLKYIQRQIEELYSPLLSLIERAEFIRAVARQRVPQGVDTPDGPEIWTYFVEEFFLKINDEISNLIRSKAYLIETGVMPESFRQFLSHADQRTALHKLWKDKKISSLDKVSRVEWPTTFKDDVRAHLSVLLTRHQKYIKDLEGSTERGKADLFEHSADGDVNLLNLKTTDSGP